MQKGKSLTQLATAIEERAAASVDYVIDSTELNMLVAGEDEAKTVALDVPGHEYLAINDNAHNQIAQRLKVPQRYYNRMLTEAPELLAENINHWFDHAPKRRMIRTQHGVTRAFLSDRYRKLDHEEIVGTALQAIVDTEGAVPLAADVTDSRMYLKVLFPEIKADDPSRPGNDIMPGVLLTNSEVGLGSLNVSGFWFRSYCTNGCVWGGDEMFGMQRRHLGGRLIEGMDYQVVSDETQQAEDQAILLSVRDSFKAASDPRFFNEFVEQLRGAHESSTMVNPEKGIEVLAKEVGLTDTERNAALINLIEDRDYSQYGALNAVTKIANEAENFDRIHDLENMGNRILQLKPREWERIAVAA